MRLETALCSDNRLIPRCKQFPVGDRLPTQWPLTQHYIVASRQIIHLRWALRCTSLTGRQMDDNTAVMDVLR
ncbi:hypothetical protein J6590_005317 [Homalodisca vitripennis]|nr:hypothetical protein J6590_005317 [Homalodisca vitripennis]